MNKTLYPLVGALLLLTQCVPSFAQQSRRVRNAASLPSTQSTYVPDGSISESANANSATRFQLQKTIHGPVVGMPGDPVSRGVFQGNQSCDVYGTRSGLPRCLSSPYIDGYGDHVRSDLGHQINGNAARDSGAARQSGGSGGNIGLPRTVSSPYVDGYGDHVRSDLGYRINGQRYGTRSAARQTVRPEPVQAPMYSYGDPLTPAYRTSK